MRDALTLVGVSGITTSDVQRFGRQKGHKELYRGAEYVIDYLPKTRLEVVVANDRLDETIETIETIVKVAIMGKIGDGKFFLINQDQIVRIRTGETGENAL